MLHTQFFFYTLSCPNPKLTDDNRILITYRCWTGEIGAIYAMSHTTFVHVSKSFPSTIGPNISYHSHNCSLVQLMHSEFYMYRSGNIKIFVYIPMVLKYHWYNMRLIFISIWFEKACWFLSRNFLFCAYLIDSIHRERC